MEFKLERRQTPLEMTGDEFAELGHRLVDEIASLLDSMRDRRLGPDETPAEIRSFLGSDAPLPEHGTEAPELLSRATELLLPHSLYNGHPRFFGYITAGAAPMGILADFLAAAVNPNLGGWTLSPMASEMESQAVRWIAELVGYPAGGDGVLVSGGNMANMLGFWAARAAKATWDVRQEGLRASEARTLRAYVPLGTHTWIQKAADLSGMGADGVRWVPTTHEGTVKVEALREQILRDREAGDLPFLVVGTGGSVSTGVVDPLPELRALCDELDLWFHVDGAYGAFAATVPNAPEELRALSTADSVALDPHKWLYAPLEAGCALVRDPGALLAAFSYRPEYYQLEEEVNNYFEHGIQNSRGFRALKVWLQLQHAGRGGYRQMIAEDIELARRFYEIADGRDQLEAFTHALSITTYRFVPTDLSERTGERSVRDYLNELNQAIQDRMRKDGRAFVSNAVIDDVYALRMCVVNFRTALEDVRALAEISVEIGESLDEELRPAELM